MEGQCTSLWGLLPTASASLCINTFKLVCEFLRQARKAMHKFSAREIDFSIRFSSNIWSLLDSWCTSFLDHRTFHDVGCGVCMLFARCVSEAILQHDTDAVHNFLVDLRDFFVECLPTKPLEGRAFLEPVDGYRIQEWTRASGILTRRTMDYILITSILANVRCLQTARSWSLQLPLRALLGSRTTIKFFPSSSRIPKLISRKFLASPGRWMFWESRRASTGTTFRQEKSGLGYQLGTNEFWNF